VPDTANPHKQQLLDARRAVEAAATIATARDAAGNPITTEEKSPRGHTVPDGEDYIQQARLFRANGKTICSRRRKTT
jgi:hypothetical protein